MHLLLAAVLVNVAELGGAAHHGAGPRHAVGGEVGGLGGVLVRHAVVGDDGAGHRVDLAGPLRQAVPEALDVAPALLPPGQDDGREMFGQDPAAGGTGRGGGLTAPAALGASVAGRRRGVQEVGARDAAGDVHHAAARLLVQDQLLERLLRLGRGDRPRPGAVGDHHDPRGVLVRLRPGPIAAATAAAATTTVDHLDLVVLVAEVGLDQLDAADLQPRLPDAVEVDDPILARGPGLGPEVVRPVGHLDGKDAALGILVVASDVADLEQVEAGQQLGPLPRLVVREALPVGLEEAPLPLAVPAELLQVAVHQWLHLVVGPHDLPGIVVVVVFPVAGGRRVAALLALLLPPSLAGGGRGRRHDVGPRGLALLAGVAVGGRESFLPVQRYIEQWVQWYRG